MEEKQTKAFEKYQAFFAFSQKQLTEGKKENNIKEGTKLVNLGAGMICPKNTSNALVEELETIYKDCIQEDIKENGLNAIIRRELNNYECYYTGDTENAEDALKDYPVSIEDIVKVFKNKNHVVEQVTV